MHWKRAISLLFAVIVAVALSVGPAQADSSVHKHAPLQLTSPDYTAGTTVSPSPKGSKGTVQPNTTIPIVCSGSVYAPQLTYASGYRVTGLQTLVNCTPQDPYSCAMETDLQIYDPSDGWYTAAASGRHYGCPPPTQSSTVSMTCQPSSLTWKYRILSVVTLVGSTTDTYTYYGPVSSYSCL